MDDDFAIIYDTLLIRVVPSTIGKPDKVYVVAGIGSSYSQQNLPPPENSTPSSGSTSE